MYKTKTPAKTKIARIVRRTLIVSYIFLVLSLGIAYAASSGQLRLEGTVYVQNLESGTDLPVIPVPDEDGQFFTPSPDMPGTISVSDQEFRDGELWLYLTAEPAGNSGQNFFSISFTVQNPTTFTWTNGVVSQTATDFGDVATTITPATLPPGQSATVTLNFKTKLATIGVRTVKTTVTYTINGNLYNAIINIEMRQR